MGSKRGVECLDGRSAKGNDVKAWADQGLRGVLKRHWLCPGADTQGLSLVWVAALVAADRGVGWLREDV